MIRPAPLAGRDRCSTVSPVDAIWRALEAATDLPSHPELHCFRSTSNWTPPADGRPLRNVYSIWRNLLMDTCASILAFLVGGGLERMRTWNAIGETA